MTFFSTKLRLTNTGTPVSIRKQTQYQPDSSISVQSSITARKDGTGSTFISRLPLTFSPCRIGSLSNTCLLSLISDPMGNFQPSHRRSVLTRSAGRKYQSASLLYLSCYNPPEITQFFEQLGISHYCAFGKI